MSETCKHEWDLDECPDCSNLPTRADLRARVAELTEELATARTRESSKPPDCGKPVCGTCKGTEWVRGTSAYGNGGSVPCPDCKPIVPVTRREETK